MPNTKRKTLYVTRRHETGKWYIVSKALKIDYELDKKADAIKYIKENFENVKVLVQNHKSKWSYSFIVTEQKEIAEFKKTKHFEDDEISAQMTDAEMKEYIQQHENGVFVPKAVLAFIVFTMLLSLILGIVAIAMSV